MQNTVTVNGITLTRAQVEDALHRLNTPTQPTLRHGDVVIEFEEWGHREPFMFLDIPTVQKAIALAEERSGHSKWPMGISVLATGEVCPRRVSHSTYRTFGRGRLTFTLEDAR